MIYQREFWLTGLLLIRNWVSIDFAWSNATLKKCLSYLVRHGIHDVLACLQRDQYVGFRHVQNIITTSSRFPGSTVYDHCQEGAIEVLTRISTTRLTSETNSPYHNTVLELSRRRSPPMLLDWTTEMTRSVNKGNVPVSSTHLSDFDHNFVSICDSFGSEIVEGNIADHSYHLPLDVPSQGLQGVSI